MSPAEVVPIERIEVELAREEAARERRPGEDADPVLAREWKDVSLRLTVKEAVLVLQRGYGPDRERALDRRGGMVRDAAVADLALGNELLQLAPRLLDRRRAVDVVELQEVDDVGAKAAQARLEIGTNALGA
jgi:hypothetical protein